VAQPYTASLPDPLAGVRKKVERAQHHLHGLDREVRDFFRDDDAYVITDEFDAERSSYVFHIHFHKRPPLDWGVVVGEFVHDLRSALDHLAWQFIRLKRKKPRGAPGYPLLTKEPADFRATVRGSANCPGPLYGAPDDAIAIVEATQPYHGGRCGLLDVLNRLWNADKHRFLIPTFFTVRGAALLSTRYTANADAGPVMRIQLGTYSGPFDAELVVIGLQPTGAEPKGGDARRAAPRSH